MVPAVKVAEGESPPSWGELFAILKRNKPFARLVLAYFIDRLAMGTYFFVQPILISFALGMPEHLLWIGSPTRLPPCCLRAAVGADHAVARQAPRLLRGQRRDDGVVCAAVHGGARQALDRRLANLVMGLGNGGTMITPPAMAADTVDHDELQSGVQQMGGHMAFLAFVFKAGMACGPLVGATFLAIFGYEQSGQALDAGSSLGIRLCASWLPVLLLLVPVLHDVEFPDRFRASRGDPAHARGASHGLNRSGLRRVLPVRPRPRP